MSGYFLVIYELINSINIYFAFTNLQIFSLKKIYKLVLCSYIFVVILFLYPKYGQSIVYFLVASAMIIIALSDRKHSIQNISLSLSGYLIYVIINYVISMIMEFLGYSSYEISISHPFITIIVNSVISFSVTFFVGKSIRERFIKYNFPKELFVLILSELSICTGIYAFNISYGAKYSYPKKMVYSNAVIFITFFIATMIVVFFLIKAMKKIYILQAHEREAEQLKEYTEKLEEINQEMRIFRHDYMNILNTINGYIINDDMSHLKDYFEKSILPKGQVLSENDILISRLSYMEIPEIKGILYVQLTDALNNNLAVVFEILKPIKRIDMDILNLSIIVGNFLDNAIEEAEKSKDRQLNIIFDGQEEYVTITIENSTDKETDIGEIRQEYYTTKQNHMGLGLYNVEKILNQCENVLHTTSCLDGVFRQSLQIFYTQKEEKCT